MRILFIGAHGDDECLSAGATLLKHAARGDDLFWVIVATPSSLTSSATPNRWAGTAVARMLERDAVAAAFGFKDREELGFPPAALDTVAFGEIVDRVRGAVRRLRPDVIYTVWPADRHSDHQIVARAVLAAWPAWRGGVKALRMGETPSSTEAVFAPDLWVDISPFLDKKVEILNLYKSEVREPPHPRNADGVRAWARYRGAQVGVAAAEAFRTAWAVA